MRELLLTEINGRGHTVTLEIDETNQIDSGGFGAIFAVSNIANVVIKRLDVYPPKPLAAIRDYTAHITVTRARLEKIINGERGQTKPRPFIIEFITEILAHSLSTYWTCDIEDLHITAVWLLQRRASGLSLQELFSERRAPSAAIRKRIAKHFLRRMRTLRRADLIHLDCVPENVFYDPVTDRLTMIDLDGCGIVRRAARWSHTSLDEWDYAPFTLGHTKQVRLPPWYPQAGLQLGPKKGNYLFGERWVVLDTVIRILTWGKHNVLTWLDDSRARTELGGAYKDIANEFESIKAATDDADAAAAWWLSTAQEVLQKLAVRYRSMLSSTSWITSGEPECLSYFADLAQQAYFEPPALSTAPGTPPLYDVFLRHLA